MIDAAKVLGEIIALLGGLGSFLGVFGLALVILTLMLMSFISAVSPMPRQANFFSSVGIVSAVALFQGTQGGEFTSYALRLLPYFVVMVAPYLLAAGLRLTWKMVNRPTIAQENERLARIERISAELAREVESLKKWG